MRKTPKEIAAERWQLSLLYKKIFNSPDGTAILRDLERAAMYHLTSCPPGIQPTDAFFNEGMKEMVRHINRELKRRNPDEKELATEAVSNG